jgi:hypothetical protein
MKGRPVRILPFVPETGGEIPIAKVFGIHRVDVAEFNDIGALTHHLLEPDRVS